MWIGRRYSELNRRRAGLKKKGIGSEIFVGVWCLSF
jgi:hypothetical protein